MADTQGLQLAFESEIQKISSPLLQAKATYLLETYIQALQKQSALEANEIVSYSIAGRSFTRRDGTAGRSLVTGMERELKDLIYGTVTLVDMNSSV